ncbi:MAG TPA: hypothetical protein VK835_04485 [Bacteroidia bacterium]|nr:hypothetical protein [Bacteroidia bacterium]
MPKQLKHSVLSLLLAIVVFTSCDKRPFAHVELYGSIVNARTNTALQGATVELWVGSYPGDNGSTKFGSATTDSNGNFDIQSGAQWNGDDYSLLIISNNINASTSVTKQYHVTRHQKFNVGTIYL